MTERKREWISRKHNIKTCFKLWCFLVNFSLLLKCVVSQECVEIYPASEVYVEIGKPVELLCLTKGDFSSDYLEFTWQGKHVESTRYNDTAIKLVTIPKPLSGKNKITYGCKSKYVDCKTNTAKAVYVSLPPKEIKDFQCISDNFETLYCSWISPDTINTQYEVFYSDYRGLLQGQTAQVNKSTNRRYCLWGSNTVPPYRRDAKNFTLFIKSSNPLGIANEAKIISDHFSIVIPAAVQNLTHVHVSPHHVQLQWEVHVHNNLVINLLGEYEYKIVCDLIEKLDKPKHIKTLKHFDKILTNNNVITYNVTDLPYAHMQYRFRVYMKPDTASEKFWSKPSELYVNTSSEVPRAPNVPSGSFHQIKFEKDRQIHIYWKELEENEKAGANFSYSIHMKHGMIKKTYKSTQGYLRLINTPKENIDVSIWAENEIGKSINASYLYIPFASTPQVSSFTKHTYINGTNKLSWLGVANVDNYTIFWCPYNIKNNCTNSINYAVVGPNENDFFITLPRNSLYQFAISANYREATNGMTWTVCETHEGSPLSDFNVKFKDYSNLAKTSVKLHWSLNCILEEGYLHRYIITYCPKGIPSSNCKYKSEYTYNTEQHKFIDGLEPHTTYLFTIKLDTVDGIKSINETSVVLTLPDTPSRPRNVKVSTVLKDSLVIDFDPPSPLNGDKGDIRYEVFNMSNELRSSFKTPITISNLNSYTNYSLSVRACNVKINSCSNKTENIFVRTRIGHPDRLETPTYEVIESNKFIFKWKEPKIRGGNVDFYQIKVIKDSTEEIIDVSKRNDVEFQPCDRGVDNVGFRVRAVNNDSDAHHGALADSDRVFLPKRDHSVFTLFHGEWSEERPVPCQRPVDLTALYFMAIVVGTILLGYSVRKYHRMIQAKQDIYPIFAQGLLPSNMIPPTTINENRTILSKIWLLLCKRSQTRVNQFNQQVSVDSSRPLICQDNILKDHLISKSPTTMSITTESLNNLKNSHGTKICKDVDASMKINVQPTPNSKTRTDIISNKFLGTKHSENTELKKENERIISKVKNNVDNSLRNESKAPKPIVNSKTGYVQSSFINTCKNSKPVVNTNTKTMIVPEVNAPITSTVQKHNTGYVKAAPIALNHKNSSQGLSKPINHHNISRSTSKEPDMPSMESVELKNRDIAGAEVLNRNRDKQIENKLLNPGSGYVKPEDVINKQLNIMSGGNETRVTSQEGYCRLSLDRFYND